MSEHLHTEYLDASSLAALRSLELRARQAVEGVMAGMHRSPLQGVSVDFAQHRPYSAGDDTRFLDWKIYGKTDKLYIKQYQKETNLDLQLLVDCSGSMSFASRQVSRQPWRKYDCAATIAAAMAYLALHQADRVALTLFADQTRAATRLSNRHGHWRTIVRALAETAVDVHENERDAADVVVQQTVRVFDHAAARLGRRSLIVLISDLFDPPEAIERGLALLRHHGHDVIVCQTLDPDELDFPYRTVSEFVGLEAEGRVNVDPSVLRKFYLQEMRQHLDRVDEVTRRFHFDHLRMTTDQTLSAVLTLFLARREAAINKGKK